MWDPHQQHEGGPGAYPTEPGYPPGPTDAGPSSVPFPMDMPQPQVVPPGVAPSIPLHGVPISTSGRAYALSRNSAEPTYLTPHVPSARSHTSHHKSRHGRHHSQHEHGGPPSIPPTLHSSHQRGHRQSHSVSLMPEDAYRHGQRSQSRHGRHHSAPDANVPKIVVSPPSERGHPPPPPHGVSQLRVKIADFVHRHAHREHGESRGGVHHHSPPPPHGHTSRKLRKRRPGEEGGQRSSRRRSRSRSRERRQAEHGNGYVEEHRHGPEPVSGYGHEPENGHGHGPANGHGYEPAGGHGYEPVIGHGHEHVPEQRYEHVPEQRHEHVPVQGHEHGRSHRRDGRLEQDRDIERHRERAREDNIRGLDWGRGLEAFQHPKFMFSKCTGRKKALCIGINYEGQSKPLHGCVNDAKSVYRFLIKYYHYDPKDIILLTDDSRDPRNMPTKANIFNAMRWLVKGARTHDALFFHYSGHGGQTRDKNGDEIDGYDEIIFPVDYQRAGDILDDDLHATMVKPLPPGCRLTAVFDSCHSGSVLDLPYMYHSNGRLKGSDVAPRFRNQRSTPAEVICWSGCKDSGTTVDTREGGLPVGAMSYAFLKVLKRNPKITYRDLLRGLKDVTKRYKQKAQLSAGHRIDTERRFIM